MDDKVKVDAVEFNDGSAMEEIRGYRSATFANGMVEWVWESSALAIPIHRIKSIATLIE